ncbi:hypothetical protein QWJ34_01600 [Saccharibacillus sp. CPCC 101409]|uniref:YcdB/YcdC domain-containing protein n=1 Tax=Saccharibacillus sp. CPCC 101409 TaxID=3058041 RepID=UPI00267279E0|nr:YcdB/YcdC domain-containing protein [Saccharibacillus sp. CPCC 101409]MDO3408454.1 hypothetical protein [Saccharibacillus sp. CPCC 101409]
MKNIKWELPAPRKAATAVLAAAILCAPVLPQGASAAETGESANFSASALTGSIPEGAKVSSASAAASVQKLFANLTPSLVTNVDYSAYYEAESSSNKTWRLTYTLSAREEQTVSVSVDAVSGEVVDAYLPDSKPANGAAELSREQASEQAERFLLRAMPDKKSGDFAAMDLPYEYGSSKLTPLFGRAGYSFSYGLKVNGVVSRSETAYVSIGSGGEVVGYSRSLNRLPYPSASPKVSADAALKKYTEDFGLKLAYVPVNPGVAQPTSYELGYIAEDRSAMPLDAATGEILDASSGLPYVSAADGKDALEAGGAESLLAPLKTEDAAQRQLEKLGLVPSGYKLGGQQTYTQDYPKKNSKVWVLDFNRTTKGSSGNINAQLSADNGQLYNYSIYSDKSGTGSVQPTEQSRSAALNWAGKLLPNARQWRLVSAPKAGDWSLAYGFQRFESGIPVVGDTASVTVDASGALTEFYYNEPSSSQSVTLPAPSSAKLTPEQARKAFLDNLKLDLYYTRFDRPAAAASSQSVSEIKLTYVPMLKTGGFLEAGTVLDANTGKWKTLYGGDIQASPSASAADIEDHAQEAALRELLDHGVLVPDEAGKVNPDTPLTRGEWTVMLARSLQPGFDSYYGYATGAKLFRDVDTNSPYQDAIAFLSAQGWLKPDQAADFNPESALTRDSLAPLLMQMLKYDKLASYYNSNVDLPGIGDADKIVHKGDAALAIKLGLLPAENGKFLPDRTISRADAALVLTRLAGLQGKTDSFMNWNSW